MHSRAVGIMAESNKHADGGRDVCENVWSPRKLGTPERGERSHTTRMAEEEKGGPAFCCTHKL